MATTFSDLTVTPNATYRYRVQAVDTGGNVSLYSNVADAFTGLTISPKATALTPNRTQQFVGHGRKPGRYRLDGGRHCRRLDIVGNDHDVTGCTRLRASQGPTR